MLNSKNSTGISRPCSKVNSKLFDGGTLWLGVRLLYVCEQLFIE